MLTRKHERTEKVSQTISACDYQINDNEMSVEIVVKVLRGATYTIKDLIQELGAKTNKDIRNYDIKKMTFEIVDNEIDFI